MYAINFAFQAEGLLQVMESLFLECADNRMGKTTPCLLELTALPRFFR